MVGGGLFRLRPGQWTDDTSMALLSAKRPAEGPWNGVEGKRSAGEMEWRAIRKGERSGVGGDQWIQRSRKPYLQIVDPCLPLESEVTCSSPRTREP
jgi:hypothetical protein